MFTTEIRVGRLYEHRIHSIEHDEEIAALGAKAREVMGSATNQVVVCADYRHVRFFKRELTETYVQMLSRVNAKVERSAILINDDQAILNLQMSRMIRELAHPGRRLFHQPAALQAWLGEVLNPAENARLEAFLNEPVASP